MSQDHGMPESAGLSPVKRALLEVRALRARLEEVEAAAAARAEPVAIVGIGCRFPGGARGPAALWQLLLEGRDAIADIPRERWDAQAYFDPDPAAAGKMATRWGGFLEDVEDFDPLFFGISPREAMSMDPQQRLLLEVAWEALEHAGQAPDRLSGSRTGVFVGASSLDFIHSMFSAPAAAYDSYFAQGVAHSAASGRLAYVLGLEGPAISVDTACSSSLVAVHLAVQSLRRRECHMALAAGVSVILSPHMHVGMSRAGMMAPDGRCKAFDARADGFVRSEGCGVAVLKRLSDALADGDTVWAVIRGTATNQDGRSSGLSAPNGPAQEAVIRAALEDARIAPEHVGFVEAHGTGTALGDPIEVQALGNVLCVGRGRTQPLRIGSVKTNLGHLEAAAGVAGLIKAALTLHHGEIPPHLHLQTLSPHVAWAELGIEVPTVRTAFPRIDGRAVAGVSSFGFTGSNAHVVLEAPPASATAAPDPDRPLHLLKLSARGTGALAELAARYRDHLAGAADGFADACYTAAVGRADLSHRMAVVAADAGDALRKLDAHARGEEVPGVLSGHRTDPTAPEVAFLFTGHGAQYVGMGRALCETQPTFRAALEECDVLLREHLPEPLLPLLYPAPGADGDPADSPLLTGMTYSQPALFALEYALAALWRSWGVEPTLVLGHSVGEYAAACVAGALSLEDAIRLVAARGRLFDSLPGTGAMAAIFAAEQEVAALLEPCASVVCVAAVNGPTEVVVSGAREAVESVIRDAERRGLEYRRLAVAQAAHSHLLDPILDEFEAVAATMKGRAPRIGIVSSTTARLLDGADLASPAYWRRHLREPVRFADALRTLHGEGHRIFVEIGPHPVLCGMGGRCLPDAGAVWLPSLRRDTDAWQQMLESLGGLYVNGGRIDWAAFERDYAGSAEARSRRKVVLPTYAWQHRTYRRDAAGAETGRAAARPSRRWDAALSAARHQQEQAPLDLDPASIPAVWRAFDRLTTAMIARTLGCLGAFPVAGEAHTAVSLSEAVGIVPGYRGVVARWLARLADEGLLREEGGRYAADTPLDDSDLDAAWENVRATPGVPSFLREYVQRCGEMLPRVLTGAESALETLFPGGSTSTADMLYRDWALVRYFNNVVRAVAGELARESNGRLRILEVGAGTGGTTSAVVPAVAGHASVYAFTDVSELFLDRARERFRSYDFMRYGILDVDRDPAEQGYTAGGYDVVIAANVLHACADLPTTLRRVRGLLAPGGVLIAFELTRYLSWFDVTTALLEGWEKHADEVRRVHPLLDLAQWEQQLGDAGFEDVAPFPEAGLPTASFGQHVILARAPGSDAAAAVVDADALHAGEDASRAESGDSVRSDGFAARVRAASPAERDALLAGFVRDQIRHLLRLDANEPIGRQRRLMDLGLDSLMAVELRGRLSRGLALTEPLPATLVFDYPTIDAVVGLLTRVLGGTANGGPDGHDAALPAGDIDALSDAEAEARLLARLAALEEAGG